MIVDACSYLLRDLFRHVRCAWCPLRLQTDREGLVLVLGGDRLKSQPLFGEAKRASAGNARRRWAVRGLGCACRARSRAAGEGCLDERAQASVCAI